MTWLISIDNRDISLCVHVLARPGSLSAIFPMAWMAFLATNTFTSVAYSLQQVERGKRKKIGGGGGGGGGVGRWEGGREREREREIG